MLNFKRKKQNETQQEVVDEKMQPIKRMDFNMIKKILFGVFAAIFLVITISGAIYSLEEDEYAVIETWGQVEVVEMPGIKFKIPFVQKVSKVSKASK